MTPNSFRSDHCHLFQDEKLEKLLPMFVHTSPVQASGHTPFWSKFSVM
jgi:hypothetical protein